MPIKKKELQKKQQWFQTPKKGEFFILKFSWIEWEIIESKWNWEITIKIDWDNQGERHILNLKLWENIDQDKWYYKKPKEKKKEKTEKLSYKTKEEIASEIIAKFPKEEEKNTPPKWPWRPEKITASILQKLKVCFSVDMTNEEAAYFCGISERTLQYYLEKNPEFLQEKTILKKSITLQAKFNLWRKIKVDESKNWAEPKYSLKRLEKKDPEFRDKLQISWTLQTQMSEEDKSIYQKILQKNLKLWNKQMKS